MNKISDKAQTLVKKRLVTDTKTIHKPNLSTVLASLPTLDEDFPEIEDASIIPYDPFTSI